MSDDSKLRITIKEFLTIHIFRTVHHCLIYSNCWQLQQKLSALCQKTKSIDGEQSSLNKSYWFITGLIRVKLPKIQYQGSELIPGSRLRHFCFKLTSTEARLHLFSQKTTQLLSKYVYLPLHLS